MFTLKTSSLLNKIYNKGISLDVGDTVTLDLRCKKGINKYTIKTIKCSVTGGTLSFVTTFKEVRGTYTYSLDELVFAKYGFKEA